MRGNRFLDGNSCWSFNHKTKLIGNSCFSPFLNTYFSNIFWSFVFYIHMFYYTDKGNDQFLRHHSFEYKTIVPICPRRMIHGKNVHNSTRSLCFISSFVLSSLKIECTFFLSHNAFLFFSPLLSHGRSAGSIWYRVS